MEDTRIKDIMIPLDQYPHVPYWFTLLQGMATMEKSQIDFKGRTSLPRVLLVFDENYQLCGWVRRRDILRGLEPEYLESRSLDYRKKLFDVQVDPNLAEISHEKILKGYKERSNKQISEVMSSIDMTLDFEDHIMKAIYEMVNYDLSLIPVMKNDKVVGVVRSVDIFHEVAKMLL